MWFPVLLVLVLQANAAPTQIVPFISVANSSLQTYEPAWEPGPRSRSTLTLVFSCVITLFLCIWTTVHVNIEPTNEVNHTLSKVCGPLVPCLENRTVGRFLAQSWVRKMGWGCVTLILPEGAMAIATYERKTAHLLRSRINELKKKNNVPEEEETKPEGEKGMLKKLENMIKKEKRDEGDWDMSLAFYAVMGGFVLSKESYTCVATNAGSDTNPPLTLTPFGVLQVAKWEYEDEDGNERGDEGAAGIAGGSGSGSENTKATQGARKRVLLNITPEEVCDKGNANALTKAIVCWQALWMIIQVCGRAAARFPVPLLELHTVLHTFCAVAMYITWWDKPVDIGVPTVVHLDQSKVRRLIDGTTEPDPTDALNPNNEPRAHDPRQDKKRAYLASRAGLGKLMLYGLCGHDDSAYWERITNAYGRLQGGWKNIWKQTVLISLVGLVYGGVHLTSWNNVFPSHLEEILWQLAAAITAIGITATACSVFALSLLPIKGLEKFYAYIFALCTIPCVLARLYLLAESFASLRRLPAGSYEVPQWSNLWPHAS